MNYGTEANHFASLEPCFSDGMTECLYKIEILLKIQNVAFI